MEEIRGCGGKEVGEEGEESLGCSRHHERVTNAFFFFFFNIYKLNGKAN